MAMAAASRPAVVGCLAALVLRGAVASQHMSFLLARLRKDPGADGMDAMRALDTNKDGRVTFDEVTAYARDKGLDYSSTLNEFAGLDTDHDGQLEAAELGRALGVKEVPAPAQAWAAPTPWAQSAAPRRAAVPAPLEPSDPAPPVAVQAMPTPSAAAPPDPASATVSPERLAHHVASLASMADGLSASAAKDEEAQSFEQQAAELRNNAKKVVFEASQSARRLSAEAAETKAKALFKELVDLEDKAMETEVKAAAMRAKADAELREVNDIMAVSEAGLVAAR